ncbi:MAG: fused MFS/spermidine synthase [Armatimonadetes bacterium]|nr:fused MFS/spermidine synthase [Armatimonadota bacterium]
MALRIAVFGSGAVLMALEILAFRIIGKTFGTALRETTAVITVFLTSMSLGYYLGGKAGDRWPVPRTLVLPMAIAGLSILLIPGLDTLIAEPVFDSSLPLSLHALTVSVALFVVPSLLMASVSPIAIRLLAQTVQQTGKIAGSVSALSTIGSILGTVLMGFYLIDAVGSVRRLVYVLGGVMILLSLIAAAGVRRKLTIATGLALVLLPAAGASAAVVFERDSSYHHIVVRDEDGMRTLYFDNAPQSRMEIKDPIAGAFEYTDFLHAAFLFRPQLQDVLMLGLGGGSVPKRFLADYPQVRMDVVDVDPVVIDVAKRYFAVKPGPRLNLIHQDARAYVKRCKKKYDYILLDAYTRSRYGSSIPPHLTTREFFQQVSAILKPGGMVGYNVTATVSQYKPGILQALLKTMQTEFSTPYLFEAESSWNTVILAFKGEHRPLSKEALGRRAKELVAAGTVKLPYFEHRMRRTVPVPDVKAAILLTDDHAPVERLMRD